MSATRPAAHPVSAPIARWFVTALVLAAKSAPAMARAAEPEAVRVGLANPILLVRDIEASKRFHVDLLGFEVVGGGEISAEVSKRTVGANRDQRTRSVYLRSSKLQGRDLPAATLALVQIDDASLGQYRRGADPHDAVHGEVMLSLVIEGLDAAITRMEAAGVRIANRPQPSAGGKSRIVSILDPDGVRLEIYEYLVSTDPKR